MHYNIRVLNNALKSCIHPLLFFILFTSACSQPKTLPDISAAFWKSIQARDLNLL